MKKFITMGLIAMGMISTTSAQKFGYISADEVISLMPEAAKADSALNQFQQALYQAAQEKQDALNEAVAKFYKDSATMNASRKEVQRKELQTSIQELSGEEQRIQQAFEGKRQELSVPIQKKLQSVIQDVAREAGYTFVLPKEALLVMPASDDLGPLVKRKLGLKDRPTNPGIKK
ncbi:MAG: OmpH family outer membrane protein [Chitinophagaceae bacterium]